MNDRTVVSDNEPFEYDVVIPASELRPLVLAHIIEDASSQGTFLSRNLYILPRKDTDKWVIFGSNGVIYDLEPNEPVYVKFIDTDAIETGLTIKKRDIREAVAKYSASE